MKIASIALLALLTTVGCARHDSAAARAEPTGAASSPASNADSKSPAAHRTMAYEHTLELSVEAGQLAAVFSLAQDACRPFASTDCSLLESQLTTGADAAGHVKLRATPAIIAMLLPQLAGRGDVLSQSLTGEDLAAPLQDTAQQLALRTGYRTRLESLRVNAGTDIETLMKINQELATVQGEIESLAGEQAHLSLRIATEVLNVNFSAVPAHSAWRPLGSAVSEFRGTIVQSLAALIALLAWSLPWLIVALALAAIWRRFMRKRH